VSEYLEEEEQLAKLRSWWSEYGTTIIVAIVVSIVAIVGWRWYDSNQQTQAFEGAKAYADYQVAEGVQKDAAGDLISSNFSGSAYHMFVLFDRAQTALEQSDLPGAETFLTTAVQEGDAVLLKDLAKIRLAKIQHGLDRTSEALATLASVSNAGYKNWALEAKGDIHVSRKELELAYESYSAAIESLAQGEQRPILEMKRKNVAPFNGEFVEFTNTLEAALQDAQSTLSAAPVDQDAPSMETSAVQADANDSEQATPVSGTDND
jgi:predicted negative regulator of RcsB-dependent stress response